ncbi:FHA domain-containing protein [Nodosilinea sp. E11]|uniref:FHA domain-containing protein n=1 Tax=Nodosilinea sp. E11 TaxID=3037479 RepID=UPI002934B1D8|nr:FHA domain-containing protein [Nodosilinea sp. E11]WOD37378.1 FHA domain-containing protein [Nodosilinea sp. E11]WOD37940.1 FHA domain-containing protein [Nodosilinea sp. E11]
MTIHKLTLYFDEKFKDPVWADITYALEAPSGSRQGEWVFGRNPTCDVTINIRDVSRRHCVIAYSYAADRWTVQDLGSSEGTFIAGKRLAVGELHPIGIGDRLYLASNLVRVVEDEHDTVGEDSGPATISSNVPIDFIELLPKPEPPPPPPPPPPPEPQRTYADSAYLMAQWVISGQTVQGKIYRVVVAATGVAGFILMLDWLAN